jgi:hypothetical protein
MANSANDALPGPAMRIGDVRAHIPAIDPLGVQLPLGESIQVLEGKP